MQSSAGVVFESEQERAEARVRSRVVKSSASERAQSRSRVQGGTSRPNEKAPTIAIILRKLSARRSERLRVETVASDSRIHQVVRFESLSLH